MGVKRVVYVICGLETLIRDLKIFKDFCFEIKNAKYMGTLLKTEHIYFVSTHTPAK
jgi:tRNA/tmRNA/rRNA uracil-C5-methylase (TrmA/RlmC/RlmD family)